MGKLLTGYMVELKDNDGLWLDEYGVLWRGSKRHATAIFQDRASAINAINETLSYADRHGFSWRRDDYRIQDVRNV